MILTLSTTHQPATDLGYLLHKNPDTHHVSDLSFGTAHVVYPQATEDRCTMSFLVDIDPVGLVRNQRGPRGKDFSLSQYVNDRPFATSSFMSVAMAKVFSTALGGRSKERPELVNQAIPLEVSLPVVPCRGGDQLLRRLFEPLGYDVEASAIPLDVTFPAWGDSRYLSVHLRGDKKVRDLLEHLYVLLPVLDDDKHYWVGEDEVEKLLRRGGEWLTTHPERELIANRYLRHDSQLAHAAVARLQEDDIGDTEQLAVTQDGEEEVVERPLSLNAQRLAAVTDAIAASGARRVLDLGCGQGKLTGALLKLPSVDHVIGLDVSHRSLEVAARRLHLDTMTPRQRERVELLQGSLTYRDRRLEGFDLAAIVEVIEHLDQNRLESFVRVVFAQARPTRVIVTTPNREYNVRFETLPAGTLRHRDHRFEWTRAEFAGWANSVAGRHGYQVEFTPIGPIDDEVGPPTQMAVFSPMSAFKIPELCLVTLVGVSGSGKSTFASKHFHPTEVISSDFCRGLVSDDENDQAATKAAFEVLHFITGKRLEGGRLTVVDATNVQPEARRGLLKLAKEHHVLAVAVVLDVPERICADRNAAREDRQFGPQVLRNQQSQLRRSLRGLRREGYHRVCVLSGQEEIEAATFEREPSWNDRRSDHGPFDIIGDVHGCYDELIELLGELGYVVGRGGSTVMPPPGRRALFLGDLVDRGPAIPAVLRLVMGMVSEGSALCLPGNHEVKLLRALNGRNVTQTHGLAQSLEQLALEPPEFSREVAGFIDTLVGHYVLDEGRLVVAHAGLPEKLQGRASGQVRAVSLYGDTSGETDDYGLPVRYPWAEDYRGTAYVAYGHTPVPDPVWVNKTICIDTGCVFGGRLTALRYPERELVSVPAREVYYEPVRPLVSAADAEFANRASNDLDLEDVLGKRIIQTRLARTVTIREENAIAALEVMSRFAVDPRWLAYLPPTMSPTATSDRDGLLEHPEEAFSAYRAGGVEQVVCEEKHMGSRAVVVVCRDSSVATARFDIDSPAGGSIFTRTGRPFFGDDTTEFAFLENVRAGMTRAGLWEELSTDWVILDCELLPWSAKAEELLQRQYASVGAAAGVARRAELAAIQSAAARGIDVGTLVDEATERMAMTAGFVAAYRQYCWPVAGIADLKLAPFQILAGEGEVHALKDHRWHLEVLGRLCETDPTTFRPTRSLVVDVNLPTSVESGTHWWEGLTAAGGEGMVVKPVQVVHRGPKGLVQPGIKCRGREYLRIIYGAEYTAERNLSRLRSRGLGLKRSLAQREFSLGIEALERFTAAEPLYRVHECVFGILALESEPVDPRL